MKGGAQSAIKEKGIQDGGNSKYTGKEVFLGIYSGSMDLGGFVLESHF